MIKKNYFTPSILHDAPIGKNEALQFNYDEFAITLARLISSNKTKTPISICVSGAWGSGKTTLLKRVKSMLDKTPVLDILTEPAILEFINDDEYPQKEFRSCKTVWFNAWKYSNDGELLVALFRTLLQAMADDNLVNRLISQMMNRAYPRRNVVKTVLSWFKVSAYGVDVKLDTGDETRSNLSEKTALLDLFDEAFDSLAAAWVHKTLKIKKINPQKGVLVVFIDDLDRCLPEKMIQVLETIKLFLDKPGCIFVLAADITLIQQAIAKYYDDPRVTGDNAKDYLDKIIQLRFELPPIRDINMEDYLRNENIIDENWGDSWRLLIAGANVNPRAVKSYINDVNLQWSMLVNTNQAGGVNREDFNIWHVLMRIAPRNFLYKLKIVFVEPELRHKFIMDATRWANQSNAPDYLKDVFSEFDVDVRFKRFLQKISFSENFTPAVLEAFLHLSSPLSFQISSTTVYPELQNEVRSELDSPVTQKSRTKLKVFISHSSADKPRVKELYTKLIKDDVDAWLDEQILMPGADWSETITRAIRSADAVIVCLSKSLVNKPGYAQKEIRQILDVWEEKPEGEIFIIPVRIEECDIPEYLKRIQYVDWFGSKEEMESKYQRILKALKVRAYSLNRIFKDME